MNLLFISELGEYVHPCEDDLVCVSTIEDVPHFNAPIFLENKQQIGKVDEIFGSIRNFVSSHSQFLITVYSMCSTNIFIYTHTTIDYFSVVFGKSVIFFLDF